MNFNPTTKPGKFAPYFKSFCVLALSALPALQPSYVAAQDYQVPRNEHGQPDISGVWNFSNNTPLERPLRFGNAEFLADVVATPPSRPQAPPVNSTAPIAPPSAASAPSVGAYNSFWNDQTALGQNTRTSQIIYPLNGRIPPVQNGVQVQFGGDQTAITPIPGTRPVRYTHGGIEQEGPEDRGLSERCLVFFSGPPLSSGYYNNFVQIFQNADHVVLLVEMGFDARIVPLSQQPHIDDRIRLWSGDSRGYFDGNTLVVETRNFTPQVGSLSLRGAAYGTAEHRLLIERFTPTGPGTLDYEFTIEDPVTFTDKIIGISPMTRVDEQIYEYACHAGNYALRNILNAARVAEASQNP